MSEPSTADNTRAMLLAFGEELAPIEEFATGRRNMLVAQGWGPEAADKYALAVLLQLLALALAPFQKGAN